MPDRENMRGPFGPKRLRDARLDVPILKQKVGDGPKAPEPTEDEPNPFPLGMGPDAQIKWMGSELRGGFMALFGALRDINRTLESSSPDAIPHVPCVVPIRSSETGEASGFGVYCFHCSYVKHAGDDQMVWCEEPTVDLSKWPPTRLVPAPEFVEETPGSTDA